MYNSDVKKVFFINHGWVCSFYDPEKFPEINVKEYIRGPFKKTMLACTLPYFGLSQQAVNPITLQQGIPDSWAEYLTQRVLLKNPLLGSYESMYKDVDTVHELRKNYRLYLGQGIPDPWTSYPFMENVELYSPEDLKIGRRRIRSTNGGGSKEHCHCCEKKYLFDCPDKDHTVRSKNNLNCNCQDCHGKPATECNDQCKCIKTLQDWVLGNSDLIKPPKEPARKERQSSDTHNQSHPPYKGLNKGNQCSLIKERSQKYNTETTTSGESENSAREYKDIPLKSHPEREQQKRICFCPFIERLRKTAQENYIKSNNGRYPPVLEIKKPVKRSTSRAIQTEIKRSNSKGIQTVSSKTQQNPKTEDKCHCSGTQFPNGSSASRQQFPRVCLPHGYIQNPAFVCPYSCTNNVRAHRHRHRESQESRSKRKEHKKKSSLDENHSRINYQEFSKGHHNTVNEEDELHKFNSLNPNDKIFYCQTVSRPYDSFKYLADINLNSYLERRNSPLFSEYQPSHVLSKNFYGKEFTDLENFRKWKQFHVRNSKEKYSDWLDDENSSPNIYRRSSSAPKTTLVPEQQKQEIPIKVEYFKEMVDSDESRTYGLNRNGDGSYKAFRKRRRLFANRRRRRKITTSKLPSHPKLINKNIQVDVTKEKPSTDVDAHPRLNRLPCVVPENNLKSAKFINFYPSRNLKSVQKREKTTGKRISTSERSNWDKNETETSSNISKPLPQEFGKQPSQTEPQLGGVLEKISKNGGTGWSPSTLKSIVDELIIEKKDPK